MMTSGPLDRSDQLLGLERVDDRRGGSSSSKRVGPVRPARRPGHLMARAHQ
jgi:hypothetical protein